jgi:hypothetical protein
MSSKNYHMHFYFLSQTYFYDRNLNTGFYIVFAEYLGLILAWQVGDGPKPMSIGSNLRIL